MGGCVPVAPHRAKRLWLGQMEKLAIESLPAHEPIVISVRATNAQAEFSTPIIRLFYERMTKNQANLIYKSVIIDEV
jgi:galactose-1-phosphate uridylyltransferase